MSQPIAKRIPHVWQRPTGPAEDPWAWLRDRDDPDTIAYLEAENAYCAEWFGLHSDLVDTMYDEIKARVQETDLSAPVRKDDWWYVGRTEEGRSYPIHCRGRSAAGATDEVALDENVEADGHDYFALGAFDVNPQHSVLAWSSDVDGSERFTLRFRDLDSKLDADDVIVNTTWGGTAWSADGSTFFYLEPDEQMRPATVWRHRLGTPQSDDVVVYREDDERFFVGLELSRSERWIIITSESKVSSEIRVIPAERPDDTPVLFTPRRADVEYSIDDWGDRWVIVTNLDATDFRVMTAPHDQADQWTELVGHVEGRRITSADAFDGHLVLHEWFDAQPRARILFRDGTERVVHAGDEPHDFELDSNPEWSATTLRYRYQSLTTPLSVFEEDVRTGERVLLKRTPVLNVDLSQYRAERLWATAPDGTRVPVDIVHHVDTVADGTAPVKVYGYGSYEISIPPWFSVARLSLLDRGFVWALVHPRGGGELGRHWYLDGKLEHKRNTFTDTIASVEYLVAQGWAARDRIAIRGGSAGGLLVGACITMRPDLFRAAIADVPFVDVVTTMSDTSLPLTVTEWDEWGDPREMPAAEYMLEYSPYDNTVARAYPALFVTAGLNDPRVSYHEPAKWLAKLRAVRTNDATLLMRTEMGAGHGGPSGRYELWREEARALTFVIVELDSKR
ncbi:MAG TPA: S9 family peptidase [Ilumatobacteraceae bacterium]|nr:S9 family peptidase [Ilumatobacteraceae bacterium]